MEIRHWCIQLKVCEFGQAGQIGQVLLYRRPLAAIAADHVECTQLCQPPEEGQIICNKVPVHPQLLKLCHSRQRREILHST